MKINKQKLYQSYISKINQISDEFENKTQFTPEEIVGIISRLLEEDYRLYELEESSYCPTCEACGEDGCCSGSKCQKNQCFYGETYKLDYERNKNLADRLYEEFPDKELREKIFNEVYEKQN